MRKALHHAQGVVTLLVTGAEPERFLNECAQKGVLFWGAEPVDAVTLRVKLHAGQRRRAEEIAARLMCDTRVESARGLPFFLRSARHRYGFWAGMSLSVLAVLFLSQFVLGVEVHGNETVPTAVILTELRRLGVRPGAFGPALDEAAIAQRALSELPQLSWMAVNLKGTRANILVRERVEKPELEDAKRPADVVAGTTGLVTGVETWNGRAAVKEGDTVVEGDVLLSGWMPVEPPEYSGLTGLGGRCVRAEGRVEARTWRTLTAVTPAETAVKHLTGREKTRYSLCLWGKEVNFFRNSGISFTEYDKISQTRSWTLPGGVTLPIFLRKETVREVELFSAPAEEEGTLALLERCLEGRLEALIGEGEILSSRVSRGQRGGVWTLSLLAECREEIGRTVEWPPIQTDGA